MTTRIKNISYTDAWCGQEIISGEYYELAVAEYQTWAYNEIVIRDIANGILVVNDGSTDILDISAAIAFLQGRIPIEANITTMPTVSVGSQPPFAEPSFRTKRSATPSLVTIAPGSSGTIDYYITQERYVAGGTILVSGAQFGDYATAEVRDIDGVIPSPYRAMLCENWPTVAQYIEKEWIEAHDADIAVHKIETYPLNAKITAGLYLRVTYYTTSAGSDRTIGVNYFLTKKL